MTDIDAYGKFFAFSSSNMKYTRYKDIYVNKNNSNKAIIVMRPAS